MNIKKFISVSCATLLLYNSFANFSTLAVSKTSDTHYKSEKKTNILKKVLLASPFAAGLGLLTYGIIKSCKKGQSNSDPQNNMTFNHAENGGPSSDSSSSVDDTILSSPVEISEDIKNMYKQAIVDLYSDKYLREEVSQDEVQIRDVPIMKLLQRIFTNFDTCLQSNHNANLIEIIAPEDINTFIGTLYTKYNVLNFSSRSSNIRDIKVGLNYVLLNEQIIINTKGMDSIPFEFRIKKEADVVIGKGLPNISGKTCAINTAIQMLYGWKTYFYRYIMMADISQNDKPTIALMKEIFTKLDNREFDLIDTSVVRLNRDIDYMKDFIDRFNIIIDNKKTKKGKNTLKKLSYIDEQELLNTITQIYRMCADELGMNNDDLRLTHDTWEPKDNNESLSTHLANRGNTDSIMVQVERDGKHVWEWHKPNGRIEKTKNDLYGFLVLVKSDLISHPKFAPPFELPEIEESINLAECNESDVKGDEFTLFEVAIFKPLSPGSPKYHYYCYIKESDQWYRKNDYIVEKVNLTDPDVQNDIKKYRQIMIYKNKNSQ